MEKGDARLAEKGPAGVGEEKGDFVNHGLCIMKSAFPTSPLPALLF